MSEFTNVTLALDWTLNGNHLPFVVALQRGLYTDAGLNVTLLQTDDEAYKLSYRGYEKANDEYITPCALVANGLAQFALNSPEGVLGWNLKDDSALHLKAVAAVMQGDSSAIVTLKSSGLSRPSMLDDKVYASYAARFEGRIVQRLIQADGGKGDFVEATPPMLGIWNTLLNGSADATWVFMGWEGAMAKLAGIELNTFNLEDFGIPYPCAPCLVASPGYLASNSDTVKRLKLESRFPFLNQLILIFTP